MDPAWRGRRGAARVWAGRNRFGWIICFRFRTFRYRKIHRFGSVRFGKHFSRFDAVRPALFERVMARSGSVSRSVPACSEIKRFCSVRVGRFGSVCYYSFLYGSWAAPGPQNAENGCVQNAGGRRAWWEIFCKGETRNAKIIAIERKPPKETNYFQRQCLIKGNPIMRNYTQSA